MTADNADGGAMPPTTHFAIRSCCLICEGGYMSVDENSDMFAECYNNEAYEFSMPQIEITHSCDKFKLRDFGYPVRTVGGK